MKINLRKIQIVQWLVGVLLLCISSSLYAQQVTGTVQDAKTGNVMPGVNILVKGTTTGTATDGQGHFKLQVPSLNDTLVVSFIGYETKTIPIKGRNSITISLTPSAVLGEELVVTALGISRKKRRLGYSFATVEGEDIAKTHAINPVAALQGKVAGVSISGGDGGIFGGSKFSIRGASTLGGNNMPIFVIDGVVLSNPTSGASEWSAGPSDWGNQLKNLNSANFKSVTVLKGAAATALYGTRAINGAVVIKTKSGSFGSGIGVRVSQTTGMRYVYDTPTLQNEFGPGTIAGSIDYGKKDADGNYYRFDTGQFHYREVNGKRVPTLVGSGTLNFGPAFSSLDNIQGYAKEMVPYRAYPNNWEEAYDTGIMSRTSITMSGGSEDFSFYVNGTIDANTGVYPKQKFNKYSGMFKANYQFTDYLNVKGSITYTHSVPMNPPANIGSQYTAYTFTRAYPTEKFKHEKVYVADHGGVPSTQYGDKYATVPGNSFWFSTYKYTTRRIENTWRPILTVSADVTEWLNLSLTGNMNVFNYTAETKELGQGYRNEGGYYRLGQHREQQENVQFTAQMTRDFGDFGLDATVGAELFHTETVETGSNTNGGLIVPGRFFMDNSKDQLSSWAYVSQEKQIASLYALISLSWKDQLFLDITGRNDWSSTLVYADGSGDYSFFYPSVSASWIFSETFDLPDWISFGKLRASWARVGSATNPYSINQGYGLGLIQLPNGNIYTNSFEQILISPNLKPEQKRSYEFGVNLEFFEGRFGIDFTWYKENTFNQILDIPAPITSGATAQRINAGNIQNKGIELSVNVTPIRTKEFSWDLTFNYTRNRNKIISLHEDVGDYKLLAGNPSYGNYRIGSAAYIGGDYGVLLSDIAPARYQATDAQGNPIESPKNGMKVLVYDKTSRSAYYKRSGDVQKIGSIQPDFVGSMSSSLHYKNWSLSFVIDGHFGSNVASFTNRYGTAWGYMQSSTKGLNAEHGGITWTSHYNGTEGRTFDDGVIVEGVFADGTVVTTPKGVKKDIGGMTFRKALEAGYIEPSHASAVTYYNNSWGTGTINDTWFYELNYIALRQVSIYYTLPTSFTKDLGLRNVQIGLMSRNVLYLYNSSPNNMHPETFRGNSAAYSYFERTPRPYSRSIFLSIDFSF